MPLAPVERVLQALVDAGFEVDQAGRALTLITETAYTAGRAAVLAARNRVHPNVPEVANALQSAPGNEFPVLRRVVAAGEGSGTGQDPGQLEFNLMVVIAGLERVLARPLR